MGKFKMEQTNCKLLFFNLNSVRVKSVHCHTHAGSDIPIDSVFWTKVVITWSLVISLLTRIPMLYGMFHRRRSLLLSEYHTQEVLVWWGQSYCLLSDLTKIYIKVGYCHCWIGNKSSKQKQEWWTSDHFGQEL